VTVKLSHESLAETHHLVVALATWREVRTTLCTTHRESSKRVLESLLESKELQDTQVNRLVEAKTSLVRADYVVVLNAVTHVSLNITLIIYPRNTELDDAVWDAEALDEVCLLELRVLVVLFLDSTENLTNCLDVLRLVLGIFFGDSRLLQMLS